MAAAKKKTLLLTSLEDVIEAMEITDQLSELVGFSSKEQVLLRLVMEEAAVNALQYGRNDSHKKIEVNWTSTLNNLAISVKQQGHLFKIEKNNEINVSSRGRGLQLILSIMDHVWLEEEEGLVVLHMKKILDEL